VFKIEKDKSKFIEDKMNKIIKSLVFLLLLFFTYSCENSFESSLEYNEGTIRELVLRDKFINNYSGALSNKDRIDTTYQVYFVGFYKEIDSNYVFRGDAIDPSDKFLIRFIGYIKRVKKRSDGEKVGWDFVDKITKKKGMIFRVGPIKWISETEAEVEAGYFEGFTSADCETYWLNKKNGNWTITEKKLRWVS